MISFMAVFNVNNPVSIGNISLTALIIAEV